MEPTLKFPELAHVFLLWKQQYGCHQGFHLTFFQLPPRVLSPGISSVASIGHLLHWRPVNSDHVYFSATACSSTDLAMTGKTDFNVAVCHRSKSYRARSFHSFPGSFCNVFINYVPPGYEWANSPGSSDNF